MSADAPDPGQTHYYGDGCDPPHVPPESDSEWVARVLAMLDGTDHV